MPALKSLVFLSVLICLSAPVAPISTGASAQSDSPSEAKRRASSVIGRWDLTIHARDGDYPSWLDVQKSGYHTVVGYFVGQIGSVRPISRVEVDNGRLRFSMPPQWESWPQDHVFEGRLEGDVLRGDTTDDKGRPVRWEGRRAPALKRAPPAAWGEPVELFNGRDLDGWKPRLATVKNGWKAKDGLLANVEPGNDLLTEKKFTDFKLHAEFRYPRGSNSGIYLRGRYEVQIEDNFGDEPESHKIGGIYGFLTPRVNAARPAGQWQSMDITLVGRVVTVVFNGELVIDRQSIPGITGGALDSDEGQPGPVMLQGDHGPIEFRKVTLWQASSNSGKVKAMKQVALSEIKDGFSKYLRLAETEEIVITKHGKPAGVLVGFASEDDWFDYMLEHDPRFLRRIAQARESLKAGKGIKLEALELADQTDRRRNKRKA